MEDGPPIFRQDITCPALLDFTLDEASVTGLSTLYRQAFQLVHLLHRVLKG
ncbi:serine acetyltransferase [Vibrio cholerae HC-46B1]|nr:serine acetyltransferase [Vibrio cholerae HC-46B1]